MQFAKSNIPSLHQNAELHSPKFNMLQLISICLIYIDDVVMLTLKFKGWGYWMIPFFGVFGASTLNPFGFRPQPPAGTTRVNLGFFDAGFSAFAPIPLNSIKEHTHIQHTYTHT